MLFKDKTITMTVDLKQKENIFLNDIMSKYLHRQCTDADARNITLRYHHPVRQDVYDLMYGSINLGTVRKSVLFGKTKMKFQPSQHFSKIAK